MTRPINVVGNGLWNALGNGMGAVTGIVASLLIVRSLSVEDYGVYSYFLWLAGTLSVLGALAFPPALTKLASELRGGDRSTEAHALTRWATIGVFLLNIVLAAVILLWALYADDPQRLYLLIIAAIVLPQNLAAMLRSGHWAQQQYRPVSLALIAGFAAQLALTAVAFVQGWGVAGYLCAALITSAVNVAVLLRSARSSPTARSSLGASRPSKTLVRAYLRLVLPITLIVVIEAIVWHRSEIFFLQRFSTLEQIGFYNLAFTIFGLFLTLGLALIHSFYPAVSHDFGRRDWPNIHAKVRAGLVLGMVYSIPLCFGGWVTFEALIVLLYGAKMSPAVPVINVLLVGLVPGVLVGVYGLSLTALARPWLNVRVGGIIAVVNLALSLLLIPQLGAVGAAIGSITAQSLYLVLLAIAMRSVIQQPFPWRDLWTLTAVGVLSTYLLPTVVMTFLSGFVGLVIAIFFAIVAYGASLARLGYVGQFQALRSHATPFAQRSADAEAP